MKEPAWTHKYIQQSLLAKNGKKYPTIVVNNKCCACTHLASFTRPSSVRPGIEASTHSVQYTNLYGQYFLREVVDLV